VCVSDVWKIVGRIVKRMCVCVCDVWKRDGVIVKRICVCVMCEGELVEL